MALPVGTSEFRITSEFGDHHGLDLAVPFGTLALSTVQGVVETVRTITTRQDKNGSYGMYVVVRDAQGNRHYYAHLSGFAVQVGQQVTTGTVLGRTGNSGNSTGAHLHYEIRGADGTQVDPTSLISGGSAVAARTLQQFGSSSTLAPRRFSPQQFNQDLDPFGIKDAVLSTLGLFEEPDEEALEDVIAKATLDEQGFLEQALQVAEAEEDLLVSPFPSERETDQQIGARQLEEV